MKQNTKPGTGGKNLLVVEGITLQSTESLEKCVQILRSLLANQDVKSYLDIIKQKKISGTSYT